MAEINLLPEKFNKNNKTRFLIITASILIFFIFISYVFIYSANLKSTIVNLDNEIIELQNEIELKEMIFEEVLHLENITITYNQLLNNKVSWEKTFDFISASTPEETLLTEIIMHDGQYLMIRGYSATLNEISVFISILSNFIHFNSVRLNSAIETKNGEITLLNFEIICSMIDKGD